ncbi:MAG: BON domain-containing protein, partial [Janthinobacterium sp.]
MSGLLKMLYVGFLSFILVACAASPGSESTGEFLDSSAVTTKVKATLVDELGSNGFSVQVKTFKDQVQLSGFVPTELLKQRAGAIASRVD